MQIARSAPGAVCVSVVWGVQTDVNTSKVQHRYESSTRGGMGHARAADTKSRAL